MIDHNLNEFQDYTNLEVPNLSQLLIKRQGLINEEVAIEINSIQTWICEDRTLCKILACVIEKGTAFPNEIHELTGIPYETVHQRIIQLLDKRILIRLPIDEGEVHTLLWRRINGFWNRGIKGHDNFCRRHFVTLATEDLGGFFPNEFFMKLFHKIGLKLGKKLIKGEVLQ